MEGRKLNMKKTLSLILALALSASLCACGSKVEDENVKLSIGGWPATEGDALDRMNEYKADFETANPNITIVPDTWTFDLQTFYPKAEAGMLPNVFDTYFTEFQKLTDGEYVADITKALKESGYYDNINPRLRDEICSKDGKVFALPVQAYALGVNINVKLWEQAGLLEADGTPKQPKTWEELAEFAKTIKEKTGKSGFALCTTNNCGGWFFTNIAWSYGVDFMKQQEDGSWKATFDTPEAVAALQFIKDLKWKYECVPANNLIDLEESRKLLATYQAGMMLDGPITYINKYEMNPEDYGMIALPAGPKKHVALLGGKIKCFGENVTESQQKAAMKWLEFTGTSYKLAEGVREKTEEEYQQMVKDGVQVGIKALTPWNDKTETVALRNEMIDKYINVKPNSVKLYNESLSDTSIELHAEEPVCCQDLYGILDTIIQEVYDDKNADCAALIKQANNDFQKNFLDKLD
jgi:ABC-type glycerol-3-phosphate transport system substrate-binding protein